MAQGLKMLNDFAARFAGAAHDEAKAACFVLGSLGAGDARKARNNSRQRSRVTSVSKAKKGCLISLGLGNETKMAGGWDTGLFQVVSDLFGRDYRPTSLGR